LGASQSLRCAGVRTSAVRSESRQGGVRHRRGREGGAHTHRPGGRPGARTGRQEVPGGGRRGVDPLHVGCPGRGSHIVIKGGGLFRPAKGGREVRQCAARRSIGGLGCLSAGFLSRNSRSEPETREYSPCLGPGGPGWRGHLHSWREGLSRLSRLRPGSPERLLESKAYIAFLLRGCVQCTCET